jgi:hypothetical protein
MTKIYQNGAYRDMTPAEQAEYDAKVLDYQTNVLPVQQVEAAFRTSLKNARDAAVFTPAEKDILIAVYDEVKRYRIDNTAQTPLIDAIQAVFPGQTKAQIGTTIESRVESYLVASATALAQKIKDTP